MPVLIPVKGSTPCGRTNPATWESSVHSVAITNTVGIMHGMIEFPEQRLLPEGERQVGPAGTACFKLKM
jgi:hypothetical protein